LGSRWLGNLWQCPSTIKVSQELEKLLTYLFLDHLGILITTVKLSFQGDAN